MMDQIQPELAPFAMPSHPLQAYYGRLKVQQLCKWPQLETIVSKQDVIVTCLLSCATVAGARSIMKSVHPRCRQCNHMNEEVVKLIAEHLAECFAAISSFAA